MGEATHKSRLHACTLAENNALKDALINFSQKQFTATSQSVCHDSKDNTYCDFIKEIDASTAGTIHSVVDRVRRTKGNTCFIEVKVEVEKARQLPVSVDSKRIYYERDPLNVEVSTDIPVYLHILNLHEKGVDLIFPNKYDDETLIDDRFEFPGDQFEVLATTNGLKESKETLLFVFTKRRQYIDPEISPDQFKQLLESIPVNEKRLIQHNIVIRSR